MGRFGASFLTRPREHCRGKYLLKAVHMATLKDISKRTGVSPTTISRVLNNDEVIAVSQETRRTIFETAYALGYVPPRRRKQLENTLRIGVADWKVIVDPSQDEDLNTLKFISETMYPEMKIDYVRIDSGSVCPVDGLLVFGELTREETDLLLRDVRHVAFINSGSYSGDYDRIQVNLDRAWAQARDYIAGAGSVGYIGGLHRGDGYSIGLRRLENAVSVMKQMERYDPSLIFTGAFSEATGRELMARLLDSGRCPDAMLLGSDIVAAGALQTLREAGKETGRDIRLVIYRDIRSVRLPQGNYALLNVYPNILWQKAIQMLLEQLRGRTETITTVVTPRLSIQE